MIDAVIFDFDGLIVDTEGCDYAVWRELYLEHGLTLTEEMFSGAIGALDGEGTFNPYADFQEKIGRPFSWEHFEPIREEKVRRCAAALPLLPGVAETVRQARNTGLRVGMASSSNRAWVLFHLERLGLRDAFETIKCREDAAEAKPAPDLYLAALRELNARAERSLAFEDSLFGAQAAKNAGMRCVLITKYLRQEQVPDGLADLMLETLEDCPLAWIIERMKHG